MFCQTQKCNKKPGLTLAAEMALIAGGLAAAAYFGYRLMEKLRCRCHDKSSGFGCDCDSAMGLTPDFDHISENDCLGHDNKEYYDKCGCFDQPDGNAPKMDEDRDQPL